MKKKNDKAFMSLIGNKYDLENESVVNKEKNVQLNII